MQQLLFAVLLLEVVVIISFSFKTPIRKLLIMTLDRAKRGRGPMVVKTVGATVFMVLVSSVYSLMKIRRRWVDGGWMNPTDEVLMVKHLLESTLMGGVLFLGLTIDMLHHYTRELRIRRKSMESIKKQAERGISGASDEIKKLEDEIKVLLGKQKKLDSELEIMSREVRTEESSSVALQKQSEGFLIEFNRLSEENQKLRDQLHTVNLKSDSSSKNNT